MNAWLVALFHRFSPERAHHIVISLLKLYQWWWFKVLRGMGSGKKISGTVTIRVPLLPQLRFKSRVGLAAGFDKNAEVFAALSRVGFGFLEVGSVTPLPQPGNPRPRIFRFPPQSLVNHLGFNNLGLAVFKENILRYRNSIPSTPLFANIGKGRATANELAIGDYQQSLQSLRDCVDGFVVNVSSPNTPQLVQLQSIGFLEALSSILPGDLPVFLKLSPDLEDATIRLLTGYLNDNPRFSGVVLTNTSRTLAEPLAPQGGLSGEPLFERALHCVTIARESVKSPKLVIGVGGITTRERAQKMRAAGADLIEIYTGFIYQGPSLVKKLSAALAD